MPQSLESAGIPENTASKAHSYGAGSCNIVQNETGTRQKDCREIDTPSSADVPATKENPGALGGATGTDWKSVWTCFDHNLKRQIAASALVSALLNCEPEDRIPFLETMLDALRPGWPQSLLIDLMREARAWAADATEAECKAYAPAAFERLPDPAKRSFVAFITGARHG